MNPSTTTPPSPLPQLVKGSSSYKLVVPASVEEKIRYLIRKYPSTEWSGILFYSYQGSFENDDLVITCQDIFPMDLGTSGWTEFQMSEDVVAYMADNVELFNCMMGLVHSHHYMGAFFSGQDAKMLQQEGNDTNCFVSLVVDTKGTYVARITRKVQSKSEVTVKSLGKSYEFFGEGLKPLPSVASSSSQTVTKSVIEYFDLNVERHEVPNSLEYLDTRFSEIQKKKSLAKKTLPDSAPAYDSLADASFFDTLHKENHQALSHTGSCSFSSPATTAPASSQGLDLDSDILSWQPDETEVHSTVVRMLTCNLILNFKDFNLQSWVSRHMMKAYQQFFNRDCSHADSDAKSSAFCEWKDFIVQFSLDHFNYSDAPVSLIDDPDMLYTIIAQAIIHELQQFSPGNPYITAYQEALSLYII